jgi:hypothetical protein
VSGNVTQPTVLAAVPYVVPSWVAGPCRGVVIDYRYALATTRTGPWTPANATFYVWGKPTLMVSTFKYTTGLATDTWMAARPDATEVTNASVATHARYARYNLTVLPGPGGLFYVGMFFEQPGQGAWLEAGLRATYDPTRRPFVYVDAYGNFLADASRAGQQVLFTAAPAQTAWYTFDDDFVTTLSAGDVNRLDVTVYMNCPVDPLVASVQNTTSSPPSFGNSVASPSPANATAPRSASFVIGTGEHVMTSTTPTPNVNTSSASTLPMIGHTNVDVVAVPATPDDSVAIAASTNELLATEIIVVIVVAAVFALCVIGGMATFYSVQRCKARDRRLRDFMQPGGVGGDDDDASTIPLDDLTEAEKRKPIAVYTDQADGNDIAIDDSRIKVQRLEVVDDTLRHMQEVPLDGDDDEDEDEGTDDNE